MAKDERDPLEELRRGCPEIPNPYPYSGDLLELWFWQRNIELRLDRSKPMQASEAWVFRPSELADRAMSRYSVKYELPFKRVHEFLNRVEAVFNRLLDGDADQDDMRIEMGLLAGKIHTAIEIVSENDRADSEKTRTAATAVVARQSSPTEDDHLDNDWVILTPSQLRKILDIEQDTLVRRLKTQAIRNVKITTKSYRVDPTSLGKGWEKHL
ncbi:hypothetical protein [Schlesneria sp. DSM 10557]|uniref:hypothetical protein n=1 Tax=Schlesneria sp. DSM 10557 TaxID=3044399 RepID=UPI00359F460F